MGRKVALIFSYFAIGLSLLCSSVSFGVTLALILYFACIIKAFSNNSAVEIGVRFVYFRTKCSPKFDWKFLNLKNISIDVEVSELNYATKKTILFVILYFLINIILIVTAVLAIYGMNRKKGGRFFNYFWFCFPWTVTNLIDVALCTTAFFVYYFDYKKTLNDITSFLDLVEITSHVDELEKIFIEKKEEILYDVLVPSEFMYLFASKYYFPLLIPFVFGLIAVMTTWKVVNHRKRLRVNSMRIL